MNGYRVDVDVLEANQHFVKVKLPFLDIPVDVKPQVFKHWLDDGYVRIRHGESDQVNMSINA